MASIGIGLVALLLSALSPLGSPGKITKESFDTGDGKMTYYLYLPPGVDAASPAPLIVLLHGSGRSGRVLVEEWEGLASKQGIVLAGPEAKDRQAWHIPNDGPAPLCALIDHLKATLPINPRRMYLFGHSAGAVMALNLAMLESQYFAAVAFHAGAWREPRQFAALDFAVRKIPLAMFVGDRDQFFPLQDVTATRDALKQAQFPVALTVMPGHDHNYYDSSRQVNAAAWNFLKEHQLDADPKYVEVRFAR